MDKLLSIIVPSYNMEKYLPKCLGSLIVDDVALLQLLDVIVVNDGSRDRTSEIAHEFEAKHPGVFRVIDKANGNYGSCINAALPIAKGEFVKILDADDTFSTAEFCKYLEALMESEKRQENVDLFVTDFITMDENGIEIRHSHRSIDSRRVVEFCELNPTEIFYMHAVAYRTAILLSMRYRQTEGVSYTDNEWVCYPMEHVKRVRYEKIPLYRYLLGRTGQTVDPAVLGKSIWMRGEIAKRMARDYDRRSDGNEKVQQRYVRNYEAMIVSQIYTTAIVDVATPDTDKYLLRFDAELATIGPSLRKKVFEEMLLSRKIGFHYGKYWLRHKNSQAIVLRLFRIYLGLLKRLSHT